MAKRKARDVEQPSSDDQTTVTAPAQAESDGSPAEQDRPRTYARLDDPFEFKTVGAGDNKVRFGISHAAKAYFLLFDVNPNAGRDEGDSHPVIDKLRADGWKWRPTPNGVLAWKKPWEGNTYSFAEDQNVRAYATAIAKELAGPDGPAR